MEILLRGDAGYKPRAYHGRNPSIGHSRSPRTFPLQRHHATPSWRTHRARWLRCASLRYGADGARVAGIFGSLLTQREYIVPVPRTTGLLL